MPARYELCVGANSRPDPSITTPPAPLVTRDVAFLGTHARTGWVESFILSPSPSEEGGGWEGVTADIHGNVYGAERRTSMDVRRSQHVQKFIDVRARPTEGEDSGR